MDTLLAPAKLNLFLEVIGQREDGYHLIESLFARISLYDVIYIDARPAENTEICVQFNYYDIDPTENTVYRAIEKFSSYSGVSFFAKVEVNKYIPPGSGLGGASSDASVVLKWLNKRFDCFSDEELYNLAMEVGSDVGFFMMEKSYAIVKGRGEVVEPVNGLKKMRFVVFYPNLSISTSLVYKSLKLTYNPISVNISNLRHGFPVLWFNRLQGVVEEMFPDYKVMIKEIEANLSKPFVMTGSGSAFFGVWSPDDDWNKIYSLARKYNCCVWCVETV